MPVNIQAKVAIARRTWQAESAELPPSDPAAKAPPQYNQKCGGEPRHVAAPFRAKFAAYLVPELFWLF
jgi:hypothetical protein